MSYTATTHCGNDHQEWIKDLDFYKEEFNTMGTRLLEVAQKNTGHEVMAEVEHFQNQFIIQRTNIDELKHDINAHAGKIAEEAKAHNGKMESIHLGEHDVLDERVEGLEKIINSLRHEFNLFLAKRL